jgi:hypothetical protein
LLTIQKLTNSQCEWGKRKNNEIKEKYKVDDSNEEDTKSKLGN